MQMDSNPQRRVVGRLSGALPRRFQKALAALAAVIGVGTWAGLGAACPTYPNSFPSNVLPPPEVQATCFTCHTSSTTGPRNGFGLDWFASCVSGCTSVCGLDCVVTPWVDCSSAQALDSDGDLFTNGEELDPRRTLPPGAFNSIDECTAGFEFNDDCAPDASGCSDPDFLVRDDYTCVCPSGLDAPGSDGRASGNGCIDVDECDEGLDDCLENSTCQNAEGTFTCPCDDGFFGDGRAGFGCTDADFCDPSPCDTLTSCQSSPDGAVCSACPDGYEGDRQRWLLAARGLHAAARREQLRSVSGELHGQRRRRRRLRGRRVPHLLAVCVVQRGGAPGHTRVYLQRRFHGREPGGGRLGLPQRGRVPERHRQLRGEHRLRRSLRHVPVRVRAGLPLRGGRLRR
jgi:hypothetical protein